jgi:hypothetical protein
MPWFGDKQEDQRIKQLGVYSWIHPADRKVAVRSQTIEVPQLKSQKCSVHFASGGWKSNWEDIGFGKNNPLGWGGWDVKKRVC